MKIALASDHAGVELKDHLVAYLKNKGHIVTDFGVNATSSVDYPDYAKKVSVSVRDKENDCGILICGSGIGMSIAANKVRGIRAALVYDETTARLAKEHNLANVIAIGQRMTSSSEADKIVDAYLAASFEKRHEGRVDKIAKIEQEEGR